MSILQYGNNVVENNGLMVEHVIPFTPMSIPGLITWLDPSGLVTNIDNEYGTVTATDGVSVWKDKSGNGNNFTQSNTSYQPKIKFTGYQSVLPIIRMEWNSYMSVITGQISGIGSVFFIQRHGTAYSGQPAFFFGHYSNQEMHGRTGEMMFMTYYCAPCMVNGQGFVNGVSTSMANMLKSTTYKQNTLIATGGTVSISYLSKDRGYTNRNFDGLYGEILMFNRSVTDSERLLIEGYLNNKWKIY